MAFASIDQRPRSGGLARRHLPRRSPPLGYPQLQQHGLAPPRGSDGASVAQSRHPQAHVDELDVVQVVHDCQIEPFGAVGRTLQLIAQSAAHDARAIDDAQRMQGLVVTVAHALSRRDHPGVDAEKPVEHNAIPGLFEHFASCGRFGILTGLETSTGQCPCRAMTLDPMGKEHATVVVGDDGVGRDAHVHSVTLATSAECVIDCYGGAMTHIASLTPEDRTEWLALWNGYLTFYEEDLASEVTDRTFHRLTTPGSGIQQGIHGAIARDDAGAAVGIVHWLVHPSTWSTNGYCYLEDLFVSPAARGRGVARALIDHVRRWATDAGLEKVYWLTAESNTTARAVYDKVARRTEFIHYEIGTDHF